MSPFGDVVGFWENVFCGGHSVSQAGAVTVPSLTAPQDWFIYVGLLFFWARVMNQVAGLNKSVLRLSLWCADLALVCRDVFGTGLSCGQIPAG